MSADAEPASIVRHKAPENAAEQSEDRFFIGNSIPESPGLSKQILGHATNQW
jgi:hypothetical protein